MLENSGIFTVTISSQLLLPLKEPGLSNVRTNKYVVIFIDLRQFINNSGSNCSTYYTYVGLSRVHIYCPGRRSTCTLNGVEFSSNDVVTLD